MLAFGLSILLFIYWEVLGLAVLSLLDKRDNPLQTMLLAPIVGVAATLLPIFTLNRLGIPVKYFGVFLTIALLAGAIFTLWKTKPKLVWREYWLFALIFLLALFLTGRPMLEFGFDWASYANPDMTSYYVQSAHRYLNHGFFEQPNADFFNGRDYTFNTWFIQIKGHRVGAELLLSWVTSLTNLNALNLSMPLILALHLVMVSATGALVYYGKMARLSALATCGLMSFAALASLGVVQQLLSQVLGIGLLIGCTTLLLRPFSNFKRWTVVRYGVLSGAMIAALFIAYQEVLPFLVAAFLLYAAIGLFRKRLSIQSMLPVLGVALLVTLLVLRGYLIGFFLYLPKAGEIGLTPADSNQFVFPFYLVPSGLSNLWGLLSLWNLALPVPWLSITIAVGGLLLLIVSIAAVRQAWSGQPIAIMTVVMLGLGIVLFFRASDYGLNKLAMFIQPFLLGTLATAWFSLIPSNLVVFVLPLALLALANFYTQQDYIQISSDRGGSLVHIPNASKSRLYSEVHKLIDMVDSDHLLVDTDNAPLAGVISIDSIGKTAAFISEPSWDTVPTDQAFSLHNPQDFTAKNDFLIGNPTLASQVLQSISGNVFWKTPEAAFQAATLSKRIEVQPDAYLLSTLPQQSLFNRWQHDINSRENLFIKPLREANNHLIFTRSQLGQHYFSSLKSRFKAAFYPLEQDVFFVGRTIAAIGQHFLFRALNPSESSRLVLDITTTYIHDGENVLPPASAIGTEREKFPMIGRGSARVFSPPLTPQTIAGNYYLGIDMGKKARQFPKPRTGLMNLYGTKISLDPKAIVGHSRDISLISNEQYERLALPSQLKDFPEDLANKNLEYSGIFEDGWLSEAAFFGLMQPKQSSTLRIQGVIPAIGDQSFTSELTILVDGKVVKTQSLNIGEFDIQLKMPEVEKRRRVDLRFSRFQRLPGADKRPVTAKTLFIGFK